MQHSALGLQAFKPQPQPLSRQPSSSPRHACLTLSSGSLATRRRACSSGSAPQTMASCVAVPPVMCTQSVSGLYSMRCVMASSAGRAGGESTAAAAAAAESGGWVGAGGGAGLACRGGGGEQGRAGAVLGRPKEGARLRVFLSLLTGVDGGGIVSSARQRLQNIVDEGGHGGLQGVVLQQDCAAQNKGQGGRKEDELRRAPAGAARATAHTRAHTCPHLCSPRQTPCAGRRTAPGSAGCLQWDGGGRRAGTEAQMMRGRADRCASLPQRQQPPPMLPAAAPRRSARTCAQQDGDLAAVRLPVKGALARLLPGPQVDVDAAAGGAQQAEPAVTEAPREGVHHGLAGRGGGGRRAGEGAGALEGRQAGDEAVQLARHDGAGGNDLARHVGVARRCARAHRRRGAAPGHDLGRRGGREGVEGRWRGGGAEGVSHSSPASLGGSPRSSLRLVGPLADPRHKLSACSLCCAARSPGPAGGRESP